MPKTTLPPAATASHDTALDAGPAPGGTAVPGTQLIQKAASLLQLLSVHAADGLRLLDVAKLSGVERSSAHRILQGLAAAGLAQQDDERRYTLGPAIFEMAAVAAPDLDIAALCRESVQRLAVGLQDAVYLSVRSGLDSVCVERQVGSYPIQVYTLGVGDRWPMGVGTGSIAMLAALADPEADAVIAANTRRYGGYEGVTEAKVRAFRDEVRERGYLSRTGRINPGVKTVGIAITLPNGRPVAGISVAATTQRMDGGHEAEVVAALRREAEVVRQRFAQRSRTRRTP